MSENRAFNVSHRELNNARRYGFARIGSVVNYLTREVDFKCRAFNMQQLYHSGLIDRSANTFAAQSLQTNAHSLDCQNAWSHEADNRARARTLFTKTEFESHNASSSSAMKTTKSESLTVGSFVINYLLSLVNATTQTDILFSCATPDFQEKLRAIADAGTVADWQAAHDDFASTYGHGFVSTLKLISCATGELTATDDTQGARETTNHSHSVAAGGACEFVSGGASTASGWAQERMESGANGSLKAHLLAVPDHSPCKTWVSDVMTKLGTMALPDIAAKPPTLPPAPQLEVKIPDIPEVEPPKKEAVPKPTLPNKDADEKALQDSMRRTQMDSDEMPEGTDWQKYQSDVSKEAKDLNPYDIAKPLAEAAATMTWPDSAHAEPPVSYAGTSDGTDPISFGEYAIYDMEFTAYADVFPKLLKFRGGLSRTALNLAKIHMFIMTRQLIGSYLSFLSSLPAEITGGIVTPGVLGAYTDSLQTYIFEVSGAKGITDRKYRELVGLFDAILSQNATFGGGKHIYDCFLKNFDYLAKAPYGFLLTATDQYQKIWYPKWGSWTKDGTNDLFPFTTWDLPFGTGPLAEVSYRAFPIIYQGGLSLAMYVPVKVGPKENPTDDPIDSWFTMSGDCVLAPGYDMLSSYQLYSDQGILRAKTSNKTDMSAYSLPGYTPPNFRKVGKKEALPEASTPHLIALTPIDHKDVKEYQIHGIPMWDEQPFDLIKRSVLKWFA